MIQKHAQLHRSEYPMAPETALKSTYMDDSIDSMQSEEKGIQLYHLLAALWIKAGMHARKWLSNSQDVLSAIPVEDRASEIDLDSGELSTVKALGIILRAKEDILSFHSNPPEENRIITKRSFLRTIATFFDPLGFLAQFIIRAKVVMQKSGRRVLTGMMSSMVKSSQSFRVGSVTCTSCQTFQCQDACKLASIKMFSQCNYTFLLMHPKWPMELLFMRGMSMLITQLLPLLSQQSHVLHHWQP